MGRSASRPLGLRTGNGSFCPYPTSARSVGRHGCPEPFFSFVNQAVMSPAPAWWPEGPQVALPAVVAPQPAEWVWTIGNLGFVASALSLLTLSAARSMPLLWLMLIAQGTIGYGQTSVMGAIPADRFGSQNFGSIFGTAIMAAIAGGAAGPWIAGVSHRQLCGGILDHHCLQRVLGRGHMAGPAPEMRHSPVSH